MSLSVPNSHLFPKQSERFDFQIARVRGGCLKLPRTWEPPHWRVRQQPPKENTPCISDFGGEISFEKGKGVFQVLPSKYSGSAWLHADEVLAKLFFGERIGENIWANFLNSDVANGKGGLVGEFSICSADLFGEIRAGLFL